MKKADKILSIIEKKIDIQKIKDKSKFSTFAANILKDIEKLNLKGKIDDETGKGEIYVQGLGKIKVSIGEENFYFSIPEKFVKGGVSEVLDKIISLGKIVNNYS